MAATNRGTSIFFVAVLTALGVALCATGCGKVQTAEAPRFPSSK